MLKKILKFISIFSLVAALSSVGSAVSPVSALEAGDVVVQINPAEQTFDLVPGASYLGNITVENTGRLGFNFTVSARPYQVKNEDYDPDFSTVTDYTKLQNWITFEKTDYYIEPGQSLEVVFNINVPSDVPGGGQYAAIVVETRDSVDPEAHVRIISQLAAILYGHVQGEEHVGGVIVAHSLPGFLLGSPFAASVTVKDDGNTDFRVTHTLTVRDFFTNREVFTPDAVLEDGSRPGYANVFVLPGTTRRNILTWAGAPQLGVFKAVQTVSYLDKTETYEQLVIICPIWLAGLAIFFVVLMVLWIIMRIRKRKQNRPVL